MKKTNTPDREFQKLTRQIKQQIENNFGLIGDQKDQVELLVKLERRFKNYIQKYPKTTGIYELFINFIVNKQRNILSAKPYFREKTEVFSQSINKAIRNNDPKTLMQYDINYQFIHFVYQNWGGELPDKIQKCYNKLLDTRRILIENNIPLVINRAKLFYNKTPKSQYTLLDFINICIIGLMGGIDKYTGEYRDVWRSVCIGRMTGNMIDEYSKTLLKLCPTDKKILYRANHLRHRLKIENIAELTKAINESFKQDKLEGRKIPSVVIDENYIRNLIHGASYISADSRSDNDDSEGVNIYDYTPSDEKSAEDTCIHNDLIDKIKKAGKDLNLVERKIITLKGVDLQ